MNKQIDQKELAEQIKEITKLIDQNNAIITHQMKEVERLVKEMDKKTKENYNLSLKAKELLVKVKKKD
jgi:uncharacterized protein YllA (UPF0747 family)